jgi:hypothetical protein
LQKTGLLCALFHIFRLPSEFLGPYRAGGFKLTFPQLRQGLLDQRLGHAFFPQFMNHIAAAVATATGMDHLLDKTLLGQPAALFKIIQQGFQFIAVFDMRGKFASQFKARMLAPGQQSQRTLAQAGWLQASTVSGSTVAGRPLTPTAARTLASISVAISLCSFRYSRELSLPWPIFSPL